MSDRKRIGPKKKIAFVCSGGGVKAGAFHLGVALALQEQGFQFFGGTVPTHGNPRQPGPKEISTYVGSSAGSIIASILASGYTLDNIFNSFLDRAPTSLADTIPRILPKLSYRTLFKLNTDIGHEQVRQILEMKSVLARLLKGDWRSLMEMRWLKLSGIFSTRGVEEHMRTLVLPKNQFQDFLPDLFIVATQLDHSRKVVFGKYHYDPPPDDPSCQYVNDVSVSQACAASGALPLIFTPYRIPIDGQDLFFIDGEIRDTLSTHVAIDAGADLVFASYTHQPYHLTQKIGSLTNLGLPNILIQSIYLVVEQKINASIHAKRSARSAIEAVQELCKKEGLPDQLIEKIEKTLISELGQHPGVNNIYIHPRDDDAEMFLQNHFDLSPSSMAEIVRSGFRAAIDTLKNYHFEDETHPTPSAAIAPI